jgi:hypothetical protein
MTFSLELLRNQIPYYLTSDPKQKALLAELQALNEGANKGYITPRLSDSNFNNMLQGDAWRGFQVFSFQSEKLSVVRALVLSNSCDVAPENERALSQNVIFAPMVKLSKVRIRFEERGLQTGQIEQKLQSIRSQATTNVFYLPAESPLEEEYVTFLDDVHSMPVLMHSRSAEKLFTLSMAGFYLFIFKLSVHFCRLHENVERNAIVGVA